MGRCDYFEAEQQMPRLRHLTTLILAAAAARQWSVVARLRAERACLLDSLAAPRRRGEASALSAA